ncbi:N-acetylmuramic acid 6-phosphate etherase [Sediminibacillus albus]|uniref:N-acetylmuramic acid 6-phosphate etherase n=1 Tax=Sediminibacillus albus TaxID=407036 RepID=A0A1G8YKI0_9BACI|nr:N-acetylmuramic acid 6-phosphate etherase [Sediminibacillus albus]SDK03177.1 N-acetylmuramic acid 6-phosphate etherase [Sediminibacillus albus]
MYLTNKLITEESNPSTENIDQMSTEEILTVINEEDTTVAYSVKKEIHTIHKAVDKIVDAIKRGGRIFYIGAGTSGRLGVLDASECPPTYNTPAGLVNGIIAGGYPALVHALEGVEDKESQAAVDLQDYSLNNQDVVVGIAASGSTPYVAGALKYANSLGTATISISCNPNSLISGYADIAIETVTGPEVVTGSTRLKAGTAQKMVLNMISTTTMIKLGKVYKNYMVDLQASNNKLKKRASSILNKLTSADEAITCQILKETDWNIKEALVMLQAKVDRTASQKSLLENEGFVARAINSAEQR